MYKLLLVCLLAIAASSATLTENDLEVSPAGFFENQVIDKVNGLIKSIKDNPILQILNNFEEAKLELEGITLQNVKVKDILNFEHTISNIKAGMDVGVGIWANLTLEIVWSDVLLATDFQVSQAKTKEGKIGISGGVDVSVKNSGLRADIVLIGMKPTQVEAIILIGDINFKKLELLGMNLKDQINNMLINNKEDLATILSYVLNDLIKVALDGTKTTKEATIEDIQKIILSHKYIFDDLIESLAKAHF